MIKFPPEGADLDLQREINSAILRWICSKRTTWYDDASDPDGALGRLYGPLFNKYVPIHEKDLEKCIAKDKLYADTQDIGRFLYLEPYEDIGLRIPILSFCHDHECRQGLPIWRFRIAIFGETPAGTPTAWMPEVPIDGHDGIPNPSAVGFRYESPEGSDTSEHGYFHVQPIMNFVRPGNQLKRCDHLPCPQYLPKKQPAMPLDATTYSEMMFCLFISLYGIGKARECIGPVIQNVSPNNKSIIKEHFSGLQVRNRPF